MVHPRPHQKAKEAKTSQGAANPDLGAQMSQEQQPAVTRQHRTWRDRGQGQDPHPNVPQPGQGGHGCPWGRGENITDQAGGASAPTTHPIFPILQGLASALPSLCHQCLGNPAWKQATLGWGWGHC